MTDVTLTLKVEQAESLQQFLRGTKIDDGTRSEIALRVEDAIRENAAPEGGVEPRYVGEHGEHNPNTVGDPGTRRTVTDFGR